MSLVNDQSAEGSVSYLVTWSPHGKIEVTFLAAKSNIAPKEQQPISLLELCTIATRTQLSQVLKTGLSLPIHQDKL